MVETWKSIALEKKHKQQQEIPKEWLVSVPGEEVSNVTGFPEKCGLLSPREIEITNTGVQGLLERLSQGFWSSVEVTTAFYKRAIIAQQVTNCLTEIFVERALARAAELDAHLKTTGKVVGLLHGLPISLKDQLAIKGLETTMGYVSWIGRYADKNAVLVDILLEAGAVPFVRTNVPQTLMWPETYNHIFGRTVNPFNRTLTSGGSSGGEGALIAMKGSPLGIGSDIGGSVRIPSSFCGLYGLRPCYGRVPYAGAANSMEGQDSILSVLGPMSSSISGVKLFMKAIIAQEPWLRDPLAVRKKWDEQEYRLEDHGKGGKMCFGMMWNDGVVVPHPPIIRALQATKKALVAAGHEVIDWQPLKHAEIEKTVVWNPLHRLPSREILINFLQSGIWSAACYQDYITVTAATGEPVINSMLAADLDIEDSSVGEIEPGSTAYELWQIQKQKGNLRREYLDHWERTKSITHTGRAVDAIIAPVAPYAAPPHGLNRNATYTNVWNALDYAAMTFPVSFVDPAIDTKQAPHSFLGKRDQANYELYEPEVFRDAPVGLQLVGRTLEEEAVIGMTEIVDAAIKNFCGAEGTLPDMKPHM
ncbi:hypothetical protein HWV62_4023 [Athelia sp. TMB]|nr:hypothetical protein HWV62_4023 [Athelia sp. TMB]